MIVCVCNHINCRAVKKAVKAGARSPNAVQKHHGCNFKCGKCSCTMGEIISSEMDKRGLTAPPIAAE